MYDNNEHNLSYRLEQRLERGGGEGRGGEERGGEERREKRLERRGELTRQSHGTHTHCENLYM